MRIIAGKHKGSTLYFSKNKITRPLKDQAKESIFNLLTHSNKILFKLEKSNILDLYAGTGSFGLECLSRHAQHVCFVEKSQDVKKILTKNIEKLNFQQKVYIFCDDVFNLVKKNDFKFKFDLIFCDPPYKEENIANLIRCIFDSNICEKDTILILHRNKNTKEKLPSCLKIVEEKIYGISKITFGKFLF